MGTITRKLCYICHDKLPLSKFHNSGSQKDGKQPYCIKCGREYQKAYGETYRKTTGCIESQRRYYLKNRDEIRKQQKIYRSKNIAKVRAKQDAWDLKNKARISKYNQEYYIKNRDSIRKQRKESSESAED